MPVRSETSPWYSAGEMEVVASAPPREVVGAGVGAPFGQRAAGTRVDDADQLGARRHVVDHGLGVTAAAASHGQVLERLALPAATDREVESSLHVFAFAAGRR